jgi:hypothetical protein
MSLFGHLAVRFGSHPENLATEALGYILGRSAGARAGFVASLAEGVSLDLPELRFETQHTSEDDGGRPDLAGIDDTGSVRVLVEAKFWAGFTARQPVSYIDQLPDGGVLVVLCPAARVAYVAREIAHRLRAANRAFEERALGGEGGRMIIGAKQVVLQSWRRALGAVRLEVAGEPELLADVAQLEGLCARMDSEAFIPVTSEELTSNVYRRVHEFGVLLEDLVASAAAEKILSTKGTRATGGNGWYGRSCRLRGAFVLLHVSTYKWTLLGPSPLWLTVYGASWTSDPTAAKRLLAGYETGHRGSVHQDAKGYPTVMLRVPIGAERIGVLSAALDQLRTIGEIVAPLGEGARDLPPPEPETGA